MADEAKVEESPSEPEADLKSLTDAVHQLVQLQIAKAVEPAKPAEIPATDPTTRLDMKAPDASVESTEDPRVAKKFLPLPVGHRAGNFELADKASINLNSFPRGDAENFSMTRYCYALSKAQTVEGSGAMNKYAPWETAYYEAAKKITVIDPITKAQGDMVSGSIPGRAA